MFNVYSIDVDGCPFYVGYGNDSYSYAEGGRLQVHTSRILAVARGEENDPMYVRLHELRQAERTIGFTIHSQHERQGDAINAENDLIAMIRERDGSEALAFNEMLNGRIAKVTADNANLGAMRGLYGSAGTTPRKAELLPLRRNPKRSSLLRERRRALLRHDQDEVKRIEEILKQNGGEIRPHHHANNTRGTVRKEDQRALIEEYRECDPKEIQARYQERLGPISISSIYRLMYRYGIKPKQSAYRPDETVRKRINVLKTRVAYFRRRGQSEKEQEIREQLEQLRRQMREQTPCPIESHAPILLGPDQESVSMYPASWGEAERNYCRGRVRTLGEHLLRMQTAGDFKMYHTTLMEIVFLIPTIQSMIDDRSLYLALDFIPDVRASEENS